MDNQLIYRKEGLLKAFHLGALSNKTIELPEGTLSQDPISVQRNRLFVQKEKLIGD